MTSELIVERSRHTNLSPLQWARYKATGTDPKKQQRNDLFIEHVDSRDLVHVSSSYHSINIRSSENTMPTSLTLAKSAPVIQINMRFDKSSDIVFLSDFRPFWRTWFFRANTQQSISKKATPPRSASRTNQTIISYSWSQSKKYYSEYLNSFRRSND